jgi:acyl carrier protein
MTVEIHATTPMRSAQLLVDVLHLEWRRGRQPDEPLFGDGLGLDLIDALVALAISRTYGFELKSDDARAHHVFESPSLTLYRHTSNR